MKRPLKVAATFALVSALSALSIQAAGAQTAAGKQGVSVNLGPGLVLQPVNIKDMTLGTRLAMLEIQIRLQQQAGQLTAQQAENFQSALTEISQSAAECLAVALVIPPIIELQLQTSLDRLERQVILNLRDRKIATFDLAGRIAHISSRITLAEEDGPLPKADADRLREQLKSAAARPTVIPGGNKIDYGAAMKASLMLDRVVDQFAHLVQVRPFAIPDIHALAAKDQELETRVAKDRLAELKQLSLKLDHAVPDLEKVKTTTYNNGLTALATAAQLEWWRLLLSQDLGGKLPAMDTATTPKNIDKSIAEALDNGRLTPAEAQDLRSNLDSINSSATTMQDKVALAVSLAKLQDSVLRTQHKPTRIWAGVDAMQAALDQRVAAGLKAGRLTKEQADAITKEADALASSERKFRQQGLDAKNALEIVIGLERLNVRLHHQLKDRDMQVPDLDKLQSALDKTVSQGVELGKLDHSSKLIDQLTHIVDLKQAYSQSPGGLDNRAKLAIGQQMQHHIAALRAEMHHDISTPSQSLDTRLSSLTREIADAAASGVITVERAAQYKAAVDTIYGQLLEGRKAPDGLSPKQSLAVANDIAALEDQYADEMREAATLPMHLAPRIKELAHRIGTQLADGRISLNEASELIAQLDRNAERLAAASSTDGGLSHGEGLRISYDLEQLVNQMQSSLSDEQVKLVDSAQYPALVDNKLGSALAAGKLTLAQARTFSEEYEKIIDDNLSYRMSDRGVSYTESLSLKEAWDMLNQAIDQALAKGTTGQDLSTRRMILEKRVREAAAAGRLSLRDAKVLSDDLDRIAQSEANFRVSGEGLSFAEALTLAQDLELETNRVNNLIKGQISLRRKK